MMKRLLASAAITALLCSTAYAETITGRVTEVHDGDTVTMEVNGKHEPIRLAKIERSRAGPAVWHYVS